MTELKPCTVCGKPDGSEEHTCIDWLKGEVKRLNDESFKYQTLFYAAQNYINESPCDPDIFPAQLEAWKTYEYLLDEIGERT